MARSTAYDDQIAAAEDVFGAKREQAKSELTQQDIDAWGRLAEGFGMSGSNIKRLQSLITSEATTRLGGINAEERMFFANIRRMDEERRKASGRNLATTLGTVAGGTIGLLTGTGPAGIGLGASLGGSLGSLLGGFAVGEQDPNTAAGFMGAADAYGSYRFQNEIQSLTDEVARLRGMAEGWGQSFNPGTLRETAMTHAKEQIN